MERRPTTRSRGRTEHNASNVLIHKLPTELLTEIFLTAYGQSLKEELGSRLLPSIASVCRKWRDVAFAAPRLWTIITISMSLRGRGFETGLQSAKTSLVRSRDASLSITLNFMDISVSLPKKKFQRVLDVVQPHFARCRELNLSIITFHPPLDLFPLYGLFDRLELVQIHAALWLNTVEGQLPVVIFGDECLLPRLNSITVLGIVATLPKNISPNPLTHLHLDSSHQTWRTNIKFVSQCTLLQTLVFVLHDMDIDYIPSTLPIVLPELRRLTTTDDFNFGFTLSISAPLLEELTIVHGDSPWVRKTVPSELEVPYPNLRSLTSISAKDLAPETLLRTFKAVPQLERIELIDCHIKHIIDILLARTSNDTPSGSPQVSSLTPMSYLPALKTLCVKRHHRPMEPCISVATIGMLLDFRPGLMFQCLDEAIFGNDLSVLEEYGDRFKLGRADTSGDRSSDDDLIQPRR